MAKLNLQVILKKDDGTALGNPINSGDKATKSEAVAAISATIAARVAAAQGAAQDLVDAETAFNS